MEEHANRIELARHALGLPNKRGQSYRNRFLCSAPGANFRAWSAMVGDGDATMAQRVKEFGGSTWFHLTQQGAEKALLPGETLCPEDFPTPAEESAS